MKQFPQCFSIFGSKLKFLLIRIQFYYDYTKMYSLENLFLNVIHVLTSLHPPNLHQIKCVLSSEGFLRKP